MGRKSRQAIMRYEAQKKDTERLFSNVLLLVLFPILNGFLGAFTPALWDNDKGLALAAWLVLLVLFGAWFWRANPAGKSLLGLLRDNEALEEEVAQRTEDIRQLEQSVGLLVWQSTVSISTRRMLVQYVRAGFSRLEDLQEAVSELLAPLYLSGEELFGFGGSERWSVGLYLYSHKQDILVPVWRERARTHPSTGPGRSWTRGEGHVGKAFVNKQAIITGDALHPDVAPLSMTPVAKARAYDDTAYRAFAAFPIGPISDPDGDACGVLVATSDRVQRFDRENTTIIAHLADVLASLVEIAHIDIDDLSKSDSDVV